MRMYIRCRKDFLQDYVEPNGHEAKAKNGV